MFSKIYFKGGVLLVCMSFSWNDMVLHVADFWMVFGIGKNEDTDRAWCSEYHSKGEGNYLKYSQI